MLKRGNNGGNQLPGSTAAEWVRYQSDPGTLPGDEEQLDILGLRSFRLLLWMAITAIGVLVARGLAIRGTIPWADIGTALALVGMLWTVTRKPSWYRPLSWAVLATLFLNVFDGLVPWTQPITSTHLLLPILVLYGTLLCDIAITVVAALGVLGICAVTWLKFSPLTESGASMLFNIVLATLISGLTSLGIWMKHRQMMETLKEQANTLRLELKTIQRLNAVIFHDIANPLTALVGLMDMAKQAEESASWGMHAMNRNIGRIAAILKIVGAVNADRLDTLPRDSVTMERVTEDLRDIFSARLTEKELNFSLSAGSEQYVHTMYDILLNSVLSNLVANAIKFSPQGGHIDLCATSSDTTLRIEVRDQGNGFPPELLRQGNGREISSSVGTAGETGFGLGLDIVALYVAKLGGTLEIMNRPTGGGIASVVLPMDGTGRNVGSATPKP